MGVDTISRMELRPPVFAGLKVVMNGWVGKSPLAKLASLRLTKNAQAICLMKMGSCKDGVYRLMWKRAKCGQAFETKLTQILRRIRKVDPPILD